MEITTHALWTLIHGMGFGGLYLLGCSGAIVELWRRYSPAAQAPITASDENFLRIYLTVMTLLAWVAVLSGAYIIYPWYRAAAPPGTVNLGAYPQWLLMSSPTTIAGHSIGMEWKEHVAWLAPISITMASAVLIRYGRAIKNYPQLRNAVLCFVVVFFSGRGDRRFLRRGDRRSRPGQRRLNPTSGSRSVTMNAPETSTPADAVSLTNGSGAAAILAAGIGAFTLAVLAIAADQATSIQRLMVFYKPTGVLSGVTTAAILFSLLTWSILEWRWRNRTVAMGGTCAVALILLAVSLLLMFPPFGDLF